MSPPGFENGGDKGNGAAKYVGANACRQCHADIAAEHQLHGHANILTSIRGAEPDFPADADRAGVPEPPQGFGWNDIAWVIGGYRKKANFVDLDGYILTTGREHVDTQWNLAFPPNERNAEFAPFGSQSTRRRPYDFACFKCHTTNPAPFGSDNPERQENRPGVGGTWAEDGVQCEACHGPGSNHFKTTNGVVTIDTTAVFVDATGVQTCFPCHDRAGGGAGNLILGSSGFIQSEQQFAELRASGGHADFPCTFCHDPHPSVTYARGGAIRNECDSCHSEKDTPFHAGVVFRRGDYEEPVNCVSCHMPFATRAATSAAAELVSEEGRMGDTRTHIFRINGTEGQLTFESMFTSDGRKVRKDADGKAAVTVDFVCRRCHNGIGNAFEINLQTCNEIAFRMHLR